MVLLDKLSPLFIAILFSSSEIQTAMLGEIDCTRFSQILFGDNSGDLNEYM
jgi:hypothetical protein